METINENRAIYSVDLVRLSDGGPGKVMINGQGYLPRINWAFLELERRNQDEAEELISAGIETAMKDYQGKKTPSKISIRIFEDGRLTILAQD